MPFCFILKVSPLCQTLSSGLDMFQKALLTSNLLSKDAKISWVIDKNWLIQE